MPREKKSVSRLSVAEWQDAALSLISERMSVQIAMEDICARVGATRGSLYWHFTSRDDLLQSALQRWEKEYVEQPLAESEAIGDPAERLAVAIYMSVKRRYPNRIYRAITEAAANPMVKPLVDRVIRRRMSYLEDCFVRMGLDAETSRYRARITYAAYVGFLFLALDHAPDWIEPAEFSRYMRHYSHLFLPSVGNEVVDKLSQLFARHRRG